MIEGFKKKNMSAERKEMIKYFCYVLVTNKLTRTLRNKVNYV